jgi:hypothetical protein
VVATCSYETHRFGVHSAMPIAQAVRCLPEETVYVRPEMARYAEVSREIMRVLGTLAPVIEPVSIDEAYLDVSGLERPVGPSEVVARRAMAAIRAAVGLIASVGIGPNRLIAKLASDARKPDGLLEPLARRLVERCAQNLLFKRRGRMPESPTRDEAAAGVNHGFLRFRNTRHHGIYGQFRQRCVPAYERGAVQPPFGIEPEHFVDEPNDGIGRPITHLHDHLGHPHALAREALQSVGLRVIDHAGEDRAGQPVQGVVRSEDVYAGGVAHVDLRFRPGVQSVAYRTGPQGTPAPSHG